VLAVAAAGVVLAGPAAAIDDATHPDARVTHGPSCRPGGLVVEVVAGTLSYAVRLTTTRSPDAEDEALLQPGQAVELRTSDVAPGETVDARLEYAAQDGSGTTFVDDLADYTLTRPTVEDCAAAIAPPPSSAEPSPDGTPVSAGGTVRIRVEGYRPGERVTIALGGSGAVLGSATADDDGSVAAEVRIPARTEAGPAALHVVGGDADAVAAVPLQVAAAMTAAVPGEMSSLPLLLAAGALSATGAALVSATARRGPGRRRGAPTRAVSALSDPGTPPA